MAGSLIRRVRVTTNYKQGLLFLDPLLLFFVWRGGYPCVAVPMLQVVWLLSVVVAWCSSRTSNGEHKQTPPSGVCNLGGVEGAPWCNKRCHLGGLGSTECCLPALPQGYSCLACPLRLIWRSFFARGSASLPLTPQEDDEEVASQKAIVQQLLHDWANEIRGFDDLGYSDSEDGDSCGEYWFGIGEGHFPVLWDFNRFYTVIDTSGELTIAVWDLGIGVGEVYRAGGLTTPHLPYFLSPPWGTVGGALQPDSVKLFNWAGVVVNANPLLAFTRCQGFA